MKNWISAAVLASSVALAPVAQAAGTVVLDMGRVLKSMPQSEQIQSTLKKEFADRIQELQGVQKEGIEIAEQLKRNADFLTAEQKIELGRKQEELEAKYELKAKALNQDSQRRQREEQNKLLMLVQKAVVEVAEKEGYDMVVNGQAVLFASPKADISDKVISHLSK